MSKKRKINAQQTVPVDIGEVIVIPVENKQKIEDAVYVKQEVDDTDASEAFMSEIQSSYS